MRVRVRLFASLAAHAPGAEAGSAFEVELAGAGRISDLIVRLEVPEREPRVVFVNGRAQAPDYQLQDGDEVGVFPAVGGG